MENGNVVRNGYFSATQCPQKRTLSYTVLTDKTVTVTISQDKRSISHDAMAANPDVNTVDPNILALGLRVGAQLEWVDGHEELFIRHGFFRLVEETRRLVLNRLHLLLLLLGTDLALCLLELLPIHTRLDLSGIGGFQVDIASSKTKRGRHVPLRPHVNGLVEPLRSKRHLSSLGVKAIGRAQAGDELLDEIPDSLCILVGKVARCRNEKLRDGVGCL